ncbi:hypothetical protein EDD95_4860 [Streptomyces sp. CEV 2-1]|nr:hypothetical protein EDD95_4860 [Streptomyces sp. CEV 2-1]
MTSSVSSLIHRPRTSGSNMIPLGWASPSARTVVPVPSRSMRTVRPPVSPGSLPCESLTYRLPSSSKAMSSGVIREPSTLPEKNVRGSEPSRSTSTTEPVAKSVRYRHPSYGLICAEV